MSALALAAAVAAPLLLGAPADPAPSTPDPEQVAVLCQERIPAWLARIDLLQDRLDGTATVAGSTAWLADRVARAEASGRALLADRLRDRLDRRPLLVERLAEVEERVAEVRAAQCGL